MECTTVNSMIDETSSTWDTYILRDLFTSRDRSLIQQIPLTLTPVQDQWQWSLELKGVYMVKSGYYWKNGFEHNKLAIFELKL